MAYERAQCPYRKFLVLWDGQIHSHSRLSENHVASNLARFTPASTEKCLDRFAARNISERGHCLDGNYKP